MKVVTIKNDIDNFILELDSRTQAKVLRCLDLLEYNGNNLGMPYSKSLRNGLFELRVVGERHVRIIYCFHKNTIYLLHAFIKKTNKIPSKELALAVKRYKLLA